MTNKIDQLKTEVNKIRDALDELKNNVVLAEDEKKNQAKELKAQAENAKQKIEAEIHSFEGKTDAESIKQKEEAELLLDSFTEITNLYNSIINSSDTPAPAPESASDTKPAEEKGFFGKIWDWTKEKSGATWSWIGDQWDAVWDKGKWERGPEGYKNTLRAAGFLATGVGAIALTYKGVKKLWKRAFSSDDEEEEEETVTKPKKKKKKKEKKPFWDRWYGRALKWGSIGAGVYWLVHGIFTGKWFEDMAGRGTLKTEESKEQVNKYKELSPEVREKYEAIGSNVNEFYGNVWDKEKNNGYESPYDLGTISKNIQVTDGIKDIDVYEGLVPFCMDDGLDNIGELLSEKNFTTYLFDKDTTEVMAKVKSYLSSAAGNVLGTFVGSLESFIPFSNITGSLSDKIEKWFESDPQKRIDELNFFFRQYTKVLTYMKDKERAIAYKIAEEKCQSEISGKNETEKVKYIQDKLSDDDRFENNVKNDSRYQNFMKSKILDSGEALRNAGLFDGGISPILREGIIEPLNNEFDNIMQVDEEGNTIVDKGLDEVNEHNLGNQTKTDLVKMCNDLKNDIAGNNNGGGWFERTFLGTSYLLNTDNSNKEKFLEETGLKDFMYELSVKIDGIKEKIDNGTVSGAELQQLKDTALAYFAFQKEMEVAIYTLGSVRATNPDMVRRLLESQIMGFNNFVEKLNKIFSGDGEFGDFLVVGAGAGQLTLVLSSSARRAARRTARKGFKRTIRQPKNAIVWVAGRPTFSNSGFRKTLEGLKDVTYKRSYFLHYALSGKIKNEDLLLNIAKEQLDLDDAGSMKKVLYNLLHGTNPSLTPEDCELLRKYVGNVDIKELVVIEENTSTVTDMFADGFKPVQKNFKIDKGILENLKKVDDLFNEDYIKNSHKAQDLLEQLLRKSVHSEDDLKYLHEIFIDDDFFKMLDELEETPKSIRGAAKHIVNVKKSTTFKTLTNRIEKINSIPNKTGEVADILTEVQDYRRSLVSISPKEFNITEDCVKLLGGEADFLDNIKVINKIVEEGIQGASGGRKAKFTLKDIITDPDKVVLKLNEASPSWKKATFGATDTGAKLQKFGKALKRLEKSKAHRSIKEGVDVLEKTMKLAKRISKIT